jgi:hypothetical protein
MTMAVKAQDVMSRFARFNIGQSPEDESDAGYR